MPDRLLHAQRRARASRVLHDLASHSSGRVLFLCYGNICRSPFAAAAMANADPRPANGTGGISSAGFFGPGRPSPDAALEAARRRGVDLSGHRSQLVTEELVRRSDCVFVMEPAQRRDLRQLLRDGRPHVLVLGDLDPFRVDSRRIPDPYARDPEFFDATFRRIERCVDTAAGLLWGRGR